MHTETITVTPELAKFYLSNNSKNRKVRNSHVNSLSDAMLSGEWKLSPQPIAIANDGRLLDGQHRLMAVVKSGKPQRFMVCHDVDESVFDVIDIGAKRSYADISGLPQHVAITVSSLAQIYYNRRPTPQKTHLIADIYGGIAQDLCRHHSGHAKIITSGTMRAAACYMIKRHGCADYVFGQYKALANRDFRDLSPINESFLRVCMRQAGGNKKSPFTINKLFNYGVKVFDHRLKHKQRISPDKNGVEDFKAFTSDLI